MAKQSLKIVVAQTGTPGNVISRKGYISVVDQLIVDQNGLEDFAGDEEEIGFSKRRTKLLLKFAKNKSDGTATGAEITQLSHTGAIERTTKTNLKIRANNDVRRTQAAGFNKTTISLPEEAVRLRPK